MKRIAVLLVLLPASGLAESIAPRPMNTHIQNIISAVGPNWNSSGNFKALLIREGEFAALYIFRGPYDLAPLVYAPQAAITGEYWASIPWLEFDEGSALLLHSENRSHGRNKWENTLTIIERNNRFIVSAFTLSSYDSLNPDNYTDCTIDMLAQTMSVNNKPITPFPLPAEIEIKDWSEEIEAVCTTETGN
ncbi:MAG: hypothetical protein COB08_017460 [Rhodobacteraceae bacterium]|nr:hypothetical protein [Paracoccaceae bacterium]